MHRSLLVVFKSIYMQNMLTRVTMLLTLIHMLKMSQPGYLR